MINYCIAMMNVPRLREEHTLPLILVGKNEAATFDNLEEAVGAAKAYKDWHPEVNFEVREYGRRSRIVAEIMRYGTWIIGKTALATM
ncbi:MAG: hypothetical protein ACE5ES_03400 [Candidatus Nanoarchaeia archaeon]